MLEITEKKLVLSKLDGKNDIDNTLEFYLNLCKSDHHRIETYASEIMGMTFVDEMNYISMLNHKGLKKSMFRYLALKDAEGKIIGLGEVERMHRETESHVGELSFSILPDERILDTGERFRDALKSGTYLRDALVSEAIEMGLEKLLYYNIDGNIGNTIIEQRPGSHFRLVIGISHCYKIEGKYFNKNIWEKVL